MNICEDDEYVKELIEKFKSKMQNNDYTFSQKIWLIRLFCAEVIKLKEF